MAYFRDLGTEVCRGWLQDEHISTTPPPLRPAFTAPEAGRLGGLLGRECLRISVCHSPISRADHGRYAKGVAKHKEGMWAEGPAQEGF